MGRRAPWLAYTGAHGGTAVRVGEIVGAGSQVSDIARAWSRSPSHLEVVLRPDWTHVGIGVSRSGDVRIVVAVFATLSVRELALTHQGGSLVLAGRLVVPDGAMPVLLINLERRLPVSWGAETGWFQFLVEPELLPEAYVRLGFTRPGGQMVITDIIPPSRFEGVPP